MRVSSDDCQRPKYKTLSFYVFNPNIQSNSSLKKVLNFTFFNAGVQGTCKYGTRVDYILGSPNSPYKFVPGSYSVFSSKGTSDHHIVKVDIVKIESIDERKISRKQRQPKQKVIKMTGYSPSRGLWKINTQER